MAQAYGVPACRIEDIDGDFDARIRHVLDSPGPALCDVIVDPRQGFEPRMTSRQVPGGGLVSPPLEDMFPFLSRDELRSNMIIPEVGP